jgi:lipopolysaccharide export system permease protein
MGVLSRYLLARFVITFVAVLLLLSLTVAVVELIGDFDDVMTVAQGLSGALLYVALRIPAHYLALLVPVAAFVAAFISLGTAARTCEFVAIKAGGISPLRVLVPVILAGAAISGLGLVANETVAVRAQEALLENIRGVDQIQFRRGTFWYHKGRYVYNVRDSDPDHQILSGVAVYELDERGRLVRSIQAARARIEPGGRWELDDAVIRRFVPDRPDTPPSFEKLARTELVLSESTALLGAGVQELSLHDLSEYRDDHPRGGPEFVRAEALLHQRLTQPLSALVFVVLAIPLGLRVEHSRSLAVPALEATAALFVFATVREYGATLATQGLTAPAATPWVILGAFGLIATLLLARVPR